MKRIAPWTGWIGGIAGWVATHQVGSDFAQADCAAAAPAVMLLIGIVGGALAAGGLLVSLGVWRSEANLDQPYVGARKFVAFTGGLAACVFALAILFQTIASFIIPRCYG